jgi:hypothetical protein
MLPQTPLPDADDPRNAALDAGEEAVDPDNQSVDADEENEDRWAMLLEDIERRYVVPIVGRDLLVVGTTDDRGQPIRERYYTLIARELARRLKVTIPQAEYDGPNPLGAVASEHIVRGGDQRQIYTAVRRAIETLDQKRTADPPDALVQLAKIDPFRVFVTTTFDSVLEQSIRRVRGAADVFEYAPGAAARLLTFRVGETRDKTIELLKQMPDPVLVHILGRASDAPEYVVTEEDAFEFVYLLQQTPPKGLFDLLSQMKLLIVGCRFPSWLVRFFLRAVRRQRLLQAAVDRTDYVVDPEASGDASLVQFLKNFRTHTEIFTRYGPTEFVDKLYEKWTDPRRKNRDGRSDPMPQCPVFISYASEDAPAAAAIAQQLRASGIEAWLDKNKLAAGNDWARTIRQNIHSAAAFVPLLSAAAEAAPGEREFRKEWRFAFDVMKGLAQNDSFLFPVVCGKVSPNSPSIDEEIRAVQWTPLQADNTLPTGLLDVLRQARRRCLIRR